MKEKLCPKCGKPLGYTNHPKITSCLTPECENYFARNKHERIYNKIMDEDKLAGSNE